MIDNKILGLLGLCTKAGGICFGTDATIELIEKKKVKLVIVANDASDRTKENMKFVCNKNNVKIYFYGDIDKISRTIGKKNKAIIGIKDENFANQIEKIINGGEIIG